MLDVVIRLDSIRFGDHLIVSFKRTLRLADDGTAHRLPPNFGVFPVYQVADFAGCVPAGWRAGEAFIPVYQREAQTQQIAQDDDSGEGSNARITADLSPGTYLVQVKHYNSAGGTGSYGVRVSM